MTQDEIQALRGDFPILAEKVYGKDLIYLDNAATTQKPRCVVERMADAYYRYNANIHRGVHRLSQVATEANEQARDEVARFLHAPHRHEIIFTRGTTEAINLVAFSYGEAFCHAGDEVVVTVMEHHSNIVPWQMLCGRKGMKLRVAPMNEAGELDVPALLALLGERTRMVAVAHVSNVLGTVNPVRRVIAEAHARGIPVLVDGAQAAPHMEVDVAALDADFYVFSGHKVYGPTGIGVLYGKERWLDAMPPYQGGGEMVGTVTFERTTYNELPFKFEAGTPDYIGSVALAEALRYVQGIGLPRIAAHEDALLRHATRRLLEEVEGIRLFGTAREKSGVVSFLVGNIHPYDLGMLLDKQGVAVRTGHHCAQPLIDSLGIPGTVRASFALYNTADEVDRFVEAVKRAAAMLQ